ncbi:unnamed protein product, partial [Adineta ricciae]
NACRRTALSTKYPVDENYSTKICRPSACRRKSFRPTTYLPIRLVYCLSVEKETASEYQHIMGVINNITKQSNEKEMNPISLADDETSEDNDLIFPYSIIHLIKDIRNYSSKLQWIKCFITSYYLQLLITFISSVVCLAVSSAQREFEYRFYITRIVLIVHGIFGLVTVLLHLCTIVFRSPLFLMTPWSCNQRQFIRYFTISSHLFTIICIIWFFLGHIWFIQELIFVFTMTYYYRREGTRFTIIIVIINYVIGIWLLYCCIRNRKKISNKSTKNDNEINQSQDLMIV